MLNQNLRRLKKSVFPDSSCLKTCYTKHSLGSLLIFQNCLRDFIRYFSLYVYFFFNPSGNFSYGFNTLLFYFFSDITEKKCFAGGAEWRDIQVYGSIRNTSQKMMIFIFDENFDRKITKKGYISISCLSLASWYSL